jgi:SNF2 family DNA or RNA helicase
VGSQPLQCGGREPLQILHTGDVVRARSQTWRVTSVRPYDGCRLVALTGLGANDAPSCELLSPFDHIQPIPPACNAVRRVSTARWRRAARTLIGRSGVPGLLRVAAGAAIDILPHQLEPAVAVLRGDGCRLLLADEVGLGKTIQACALVAELRERGVAERALIVTPPGLRDQWQHELHRRFHLTSTIVDARAVRRRAADLPPDVNSTTWPVVIVSVDFVKRPEVLGSVLNARWDIVVVDEAHASPPTAIVIRRSRP